MTSNAILSQHTSKYFFFLLLIAIINVTSGISVLSEEVSIGRQLTGEKPEVSLESDLMPSPEETTDQIPEESSSETLPDGILQNSYIVQITAVCNDICQSNVQTALLDSKPTENCVLDSAISIGSLHQLIIKCQTTDVAVSTNAVITSIDTGLASSGASVVAIENDMVFSI